METLAQFPTSPPQFMRIMSHHHKNKLTWCPLSASIAYSLLERRDLCERLGFFLQGPCHPSNFPPWVSDQYESVSINRYSTMNRVRMFAKNAVLSTILIKHEGTRDEKLCIDFE
jgi:hypothetical protein